MDDILLMAYVDGNLQPRERKEVERTIGVSADVAERVALLRASALPYRRAFQRQQLPPVPESLARNVAQLIDAYAAASGTRTAGRKDPAAAWASRASGRIPWSSSGRARPWASACARGLEYARPVRARIRAAAPWAALAFVAGAFCCATVLRLTEGSASAVLAQTLSPQAMPAGLSPWVVAAVNYQRLYARETVASDLPIAGLPQIVEDIRRDDGLSIRVPDLRSLGFTLKRVQRLRFNNKALVQMVYLPEKGSPVSLCVITDDKPDATLAQQHVDTMQVVTWRQAKQSYALIGTSGDRDLEAIGKYIAGSGSGDLLSQLLSAHPLARSQS
uniref:Putative transmembrane anti-sigma factor n=1 Tax=Burkholderia sp. (strain CCGE1003) TaxID=640512 RepID=E1TEB9_BURSG